MKFSGGKDNGVKRYNCEAQIPEPVERKFNGDGGTHHVDVVECVKSGHQASKRTKKSPQITFAGMSK